MGMNESDPGENAVRRSGGQYLYRTAGTCAMKGSTDKLELDCFPFP